MKHHVIGFVTAIALSLGGTAQAKTYSIEGAGTASLTGIVAQTLAQYAAKVDIDLQAVLGQTLTKSALKLAAGQIDLAVIPPLSYKAMTRGAGPYENLGEKAVELSGNVRSLFSFPGGTFHVITWADSDVKSLADIPGKRVYIGPPAGAANAMITGMLDLASGGIKQDQYDPMRAPWTSGLQAFQDGQFDVFIPATAVGSQSINELSLQRDIRIIGHDPEVTKSADWLAFNERMGLDNAVIPAGTYQGQVNGDTDQLTTSTVMMMSANKDLEEEVAYKLTKAYWEHLPEMKAANALMRTIDETKFFTGLAAPLHPGAIRYYRERGVEVPEALLPE